MIKSKLLASTMLVAASTMLASGSADAAELKLGGVYEAWIGYADNNNLVGVKENFDVKNDSEIFFRAEEKLDNGMRVGVLLEFEAGNGNDNAGGSGFDESFAWVKASWGQLNIGNNDTATGYTGGVKAVGPVGIIKSDAGDWLPSTFEILDTDADVGVGDSQNITYMTPRISGVQAIFSYTPDASDTVTSDYDDQETTGFSNAVSTSVSYSGKLGGAKLRLAGGYSHVKVDRAASASGTNTHHAYNFAGQVDVGAFTFTGAYSRERNDDYDTFYGAGVIWKMDKASSFSLAYGNGEESEFGPTVLADNTSELITLGYERNLGKGIKFGASVFKTNHSQRTDPVNNGVGVVSGLAIKF